MRALLAAGVIVGFVAVGCGAEEEDRAPKAGAPPPQVRVIRDAPVTAVIEGGTREQRELLREILSGLDSERIVRVAIREPYPDFEPQDEGDVMLSVDYEPVDGRDARAAWESWLLAGAFDYRSQVLGLPDVVWLEEGGGGSALVSPEELPRTAGGDPTAVVEQVAAAADASEAELVRIEILQPFGLAPAITLRVPDPADFLFERLSGFLIDLADRWERWEGTLIEVVDSTGRRVWLTAGGSRMRTGSGWTAPELEGCWDHSIAGGPIGQPPPPSCPTHG